MKIIRQEDQDFEEKIKDIEARRARLFSQHLPNVQEVIESVRNGREDALIDFAKESEGVSLTRETLWVEPEHIKNSHKLLDAEIRQAIEQTFERVERFQKEKKPSSFQTKDETGVFWGEEIRPLNRVGISVPRNYFPTMILCASAARVAGVSELVVATSPVKSLGEPFVDPAILYVAKLCNIDRILLSSGPSALAALAFGTSSSEPVQKIVGATNRTGVVAKSLLAPEVGVDGLFGPSEVVIITDKTSSLDSVAADILAIADQNLEAEIYVLSAREKYLEKLIEKLVATTEQASESKSNTELKGCLESNLKFLLTDSVDESIGLTNRIGPGLVCLAIEDSGDKISKIETAGAILLGHYTPPALHEIFGGATGIVPTLGTAAFSSALSPSNFVRRIPVIDIDKDALARFKQSSLNISKIEGFSTRESVFQAREMLKD